LGTYLLSDLAAVLGYLSGGLCILHFRAKGKKDIHPHVLGMALGAACLSFATGLAFFLDLVNVAFSWGLYAGVARNLLGCVAGLAAGITISYYLHKRAQEQKDADEKLVKMSADLEAKQRIRQLQSAEEFFKRLTEPPPEMK